MIDIMAIHKAIDTRYSQKKGWVAALEVMLDSRAIDVLALNYRTGKMVALEIKRSRSDFKREIRNYDKTETWASRADEFYFVAPADLIMPDEIPDGLGLIEVKLIHYQHGPDEYQCRVKVRPRRRKIEDGVRLKVFGRILSRLSWALPQGCGTLDAVLNSRKSAIQLYQMGIREGRNRRSRMGF